MSIPVEINFRNMDRSGGLVTEIQRRANKLKQSFSQITEGQVDVEAPRRPHQLGDLYRIRIRFSVPNREFVVGHASHEVFENVDPFVAVHEAYDAIHNRLTEHLIELNGNTTFRLDTLHGRIARICLPDDPDSPERGFGFISKTDGREVYFNATSLLGVEFKRLEVGNEVQFIELQTEDGLQASFVQLI